MPQKKQSPEVKKATAEGYREGLHEWAEQFCRLFNEPDKHPEFHRSSWETAWKTTWRDVPEAQRAEKLEGFVKAIKEADALPLSYSPVSKFYCLLTPAATHGARV